MSITNGYCTLTELKAALGVSDTADDTALERAINSASRQIDGYCGRRFWQDAEATVKYFTAQDWGTCLFRGDVEGADATTITEVAVDSGAGTYTALASSSWRAAPQSGSRPFDRVVSLRGGLFPTFDEGVRVTGRFGWAAVPDEVAEATVMQASQIFKQTREAPFGMSSSPIFGESDGRTVRQGMTWDVRSLVQPFVKPKV